MWLQFVRLVPTADRQHRRCHVQRQGFSDCRRALPSRSIVIHHDKDSVEVLFEHIGLVA